MKRIGGANSTRLQIELPQLKADGSGRQVEH
jgi:hypothetical protein